MIVPELKSIVSTDLDYGQLPVDVEDCEVFCDLDIGPRGMDGADIFSIIVVTPKRFVLRDSYVWGKGYLVVDSFSWGIVERAIEQLLLHCHGADWNEVASKLNNVLGWEFENYREF